MKQSWLAALALLATATAWGATFTLVKNVLEKIDPGPFIFYRFTLAGLLLLAASRRKLSRALMLPGLALGLLVFTGYWLQTEGLILIAPARSAFLTSLYVVMVPFCDRLLVGTRVSRPAWMASILALIGTGIMIGGVQGRPGAGDLLTIACALMFSIHVILTARYAARHSTMGLAAVQVTVVGVAAAPLSLAAEPSTFSSEVVWVIILTAVVTTALAFAALMWGQARVSATQAAVILSFEPVAAALTSIVWYDEPMTRGFIVGALLILAAMLISQLPVRVVPAHPKSAS